MSKEFLGTGWKFPIQVDPSTGRMRTVSYEDDIKESLLIILGTARGERVMRRDFGSKINEFVFESLNASTVHLMKKEVQRVILEWEPRVKDVKVEVSMDPIDQNKVMIDVRYVVRKTNNLFNLVYPFYIQEGTKVE